MSQHIDWSELAAKMDTFETFTLVNDDEQVVHVLVCRECDHYVAKVIHGESIFGTLVRIAKDHDCEDELADTVILNVDDDLYPLVPFTDEDKKHIGPVEQSAGPPDLTDPTPDVLADVDRGVTEIETFLKRLYGEAT